MLIFALILSVSSQDLHNDLNHLLASDLPKDSKTDPNNPTQPYDHLFDLYFFGDPKQGIQRNHTKAFEYLNKALDLKSPKALFSLLVIINQVHHTDLFESAKDQLIFPELSKDDLKFSEDSYNILEVFYYFSLFDCILVQNFEFPDFLLSKSSLWTDPYKLVEDLCELDRSLVLSALTQAHHARSYIESLNTVPVKILASDLESDLPFGAESKDFYENLKKIYSGYEFSEGIQELAHDYLYGNPILGISPNFNEALNLLEQSLELGNPEAGGELGRMHLQGLGVAKNETKGLEYLEKSAEQGSVLALTQLSIMYREGKIVEKDDEKAFQYAKAAAEEGDTASINNIGVYYLHGIGVEQDIELGIYYIQAAAESNSPAGLYNLAGLYFNGDYVQEDIEWAFELALRVLRTAQIDGYMVKGFNSFKLGDFEAAYFYFLFAEQLGYLEGSKSAAYLLKNKLFDSKCKNSEFCLIRHLVKGLVQEDEFSCEMIGDLFYRGTEKIEKNYTLSYLVYENCPDMGESLYRLGYMTEYGIGTEKNTSKALEIYEKIIGLSESEEIDIFAKYPAYISFYFLRVKLLVIELFT